jgi:hypothetical protein
MKGKIMNTILWLIIGIVLGGFLFSKYGPDPVAPKIVMPIEIKQAAQKSEDAYMVKYDSLLAENDLLKSVDTVLKSSIKRERQSRLMAENTLNATINRLPANAKKEVEDKATEYEIIVAETDSTCNAIADNLQKQIVIKDSIFAAKDSLYNTIKRSLRLAVNQNQMLLDYSGDLKKQVKKKKAATVLWKIAAVAAGGFIIYQSAK